MRHAFRVAASLDSMVLGEPQILGQVKEAYQIAEKAGALGSVLNALRNRSIAAARTGPNRDGHRPATRSPSPTWPWSWRGRSSASSRTRNVLLVGAGKMSELAARHLVRGGARATVLGGRTFEKAEQLAAALGGRAAPFEALRVELTRADIVISGTGAPGIVIQREDVEAARAGRRPAALPDRHRGPPRRRSGRRRSSPGVFLYDLDDLKSVSEANLRERRKEASAAEAIVEHEVREFLAWRQSLDVVPLLVELRRRGDEIRKNELEKARKRLGAITPEQEQALEAVTTAIVNKLLHPPTVHIKEIASNGHAPEHMALIRKLLGL